jgi:hypothetical protein
MNSERLDEIARRKALLASHIDAYRTSVAVAGQSLEKPARIVDRGLAIAAYLQARPWLVAAGTAAIVALRPRRLGRWVGRGWILWRAISALGTAATRLRS